MNSKSVLGKETSCYIDGKRINGKIIAIARYVTHNQYCFLVEGEELGKWVLESAIAEDLFSEQPVSNKPKAEPNLEKEAKQEAKSAIAEDLFSEQPVSNKPKAEPNLEKEAKQEAKEEINALAKFVSDTHNVLEKRAGKDFQLVVKSFQDTQKAIEQNTQAVVDALVNSEKLAREWLQQTITAAGEVLNFIWKTIDDLWSRYWRDRIIEAIKGEKPNHFKAKEIVRKLKRDYPDETSRQIANRLIYEKALFVTITAGLSVAAAGVPKVGTLVLKKVIKFLDTRILLVEMIYQIGVCYGFDEFKEGDFLVIFTLALRIKKLAKLGMDFLLSDSTPDPLIAAVTNMILFLSVGYAACEFYEAKSKAGASPIVSIEAYKSLERKVEAYLEEAISEQTTIEATVVEAISVKEELELS